MSAAVQTGPELRPLPGSWDRLASAMRIVRTEALRSSALALFVGVAATGVTLLFVHPDYWVGRWQGLATYLRTCLILLVPLCAAVATWQGGRERRRAILDLAAATSRPGWQPLLATWTALTGTAAAGLLMVLAVGACFVAPYATYAGGGWWWVALGCLPGIAAAVALGLAVGRWVPLRVAGLLPAVALYVTQALPSYLNDPGSQWLAPYMDGAFFGDRLSGRTHLLQAAWFGGLTLALLATAAAHSAPVARAATATVGLGGVMLALLGAVPLLLGPGSHRWVPDPEALRTVCNPKDRRVCVGAVDAYLLGDLTSSAKPVLDRLSTVPGAPSRTIGRLPDGQEPPSDALMLTDLTPGLDGRLLRDSLVWADPMESAVRTSLSSPSCFAGGGVQDGFDGRSVAEDVATVWIFAQHPGFTVSERAERGAAALSALTPAQQQAWIGRVYSTRDRCDRETTAALLAPLGNP